MPILEGWLRRRCRTLTHICTARDLDSVAPGLPFFGGRNELWRFIWGGERETHCPWSPKRIGGMVVVPGSPSNSSIQEMAILVPQFKRSTTLSMFTLVFVFILLRYASYCAGKTKLRNRQAYPSQQAELQKGCTAD